MTAPRNTCIRSSVRNTGPVHGCQGPGHGPHIGPLTIERTWSRQCADEPRNDRWDVDGLFFLVLTRSSYRRLRRRRGIAIAITIPAWAVIPLSPASVAVPSITVASRRRRGSCPLILRRPMRVGIPPFVIWGRGSLVLCRRNRRSWSRLWRATACHER